ncbi:MAG: acyltransferase [Sinimarinibacterium sp.]
MPELDGIRGIAVLMVLLLHTRPMLFFWGWAGVDLFLVLSGFLITRILLQNHGRPGMLWSFYARRALRIWPVYYLTLVLSAGIFTIVGPLDVTAPQEIPAGHWLSLVFLQNVENYLGAGHPSVEYLWYFEHSWSVAIEEQFYLLWPALLLITATRRGWLLPLAACVLTAAYVARAQSMSLHILLTRIDGLVMGASVAYVAVNRPALLLGMTRRHLVYMALTGAALAGPYLALGMATPSEAFGARAAPVLGFALLFTAALCVVLRNIGQALTGWLRWRLLRWVGQISFGLYMYHIPIGYLGLLGVKHGLWGMFTAKAILWAGSFLVAHLSFRWFERPILALKKTVPYAHPDGAVSAATRTVLQPEGTAESK